MKISICLKSSTGVITNSSSEIFEIQDERGTKESLQTIFDKLTEYSVDVWSFEDDIRSSLKENFKDLLTEEETLKFIALAKRLNHHNPEDKIFFVEADYHDEKVLDYCFAMGGKILS